LVQGATASLLAALTPAQAPAPATPASETTPNPTLQATDASTSSAPSPTAASPNVQDLPATQDAFETSLSPDFAMQTALRFGAGVVAQAAVAVPATDLGTGLVRDATTVLRLENLQPSAGGPGPEAFAQAETPAQRILRTYETGSALSATRGAHALDLLV
jgi:flagellar hook-length control protein FliK